MKITFAEIMDVFDQKTQEKGFALYKHGKVLSIEDDGESSVEGVHEINGSVQGGARFPYEQTVRMTAEGSGRGAEQLSLLGWCSCPVGLNCKHVAALMFEYLELLAEERTTPARVKSSANPIERWMEDLNRRLPDVNPGNTSSSARTTDLLRPVAKKKSSTQQQKMLYLLTFDEDGNGIYLRIEIRPLLKSGEFSTGSRRDFDLSRYLHVDSMPNYVGTPDKLILSHLLAGKIRQHYYRGYQIEGDLALKTLQLMTETGRAFTPADMRGQHLNSLQWGQTRALTLHWHEATKGEFRLVTETGAVQLVSLNPPVYFDQSKGVIGSLDLPLDAAILAHLLTMPVVKGQQLPSVAQQIQNKVGAVVPVPAQQTVRHVDCPPTPVLLLGKAEYRSVLNSQLRADLEKRRREQLASGVPVSHLCLTEQFCYVMPAFSYDGMPISYTETSMELTLWSEGECVHIQRDMQTESSCVSQLKAAGLRNLNALEKSVAEDRVATAFTFDLYHQDIDWIELVTNKIPEWQSQGWQIDYADDFPYTDIVVPDADSTWFSELEPGTEDNTLLLGIGIEIDGKRHNLLPCLLQLMKQFAQETLNQLPDSMLLPVVLENRKKLFLPAERVRNLLGTLYDLFDSVSPDAEASRLRVNRNDLLLLDELKLEKQYHESVEKMRLMVDQLRQPGLMPMPELPSGFLATLRDYQHEGVAWLQLLRESGSGGVLADDMGLGKTIQTLAHLSIEKAMGRLNNPALLVVPTSLLSNWYNEAARFAPDLRVLILHGKGRHDEFDGISQHDLIVTTYPLILRDSEILLTRQFSVLILDEAQAIKNPRARVSMLLTRFKATQRICLSGTPLENHLGELWSQFHFLNPGLLRDQSTFNRLYRSPIEKTGDSYRQRALHARIAPFLLRRTKAEVVAELPPKTEMIRRAVFKPKQRDLYETVRAAMDKKVREAVASKGLNRSHIEILDALLKLRQICCDPALLKLPAAKKVKESAKLELLKTLLPELVEEGRRILIFSQFTSMLARIEDWLVTAAIDYVKLTGSTRHRHIPLERFQQGEVPVFLISLKAGGTGLNLTAADTVIHYDPWWNPAVEDQATDRAHRIGQDKPVFVYRLIVEDTVEEKMLWMQDRKRALANTIYDNTGKLGYEFNEEDLADLFQ